MTKTDLKPGDRIERWDEGLRRYTVVKVGRRWVTLLDISTMHTLVVGINALMIDRSFSIVESNPRTIRLLIKENLRVRRLLGLRTAVAAAKTVLKLLEQPR